MPDDHSKVVPLLPIPNRTVKRLSADDSAGSRVKVGHRQALTAQNASPTGEAFCFVRAKSVGAVAQGALRVIAQTVDSIQGPVQPDCHEPQRFSLQALRPQ